MDINLFRKDKGGDPDVVRESQRRRFAPVEQVDVVIALDEAWRKARFNLDQKNKEIGKLKKEVGLLKKDGKNADDLIAEQQKKQKEAEELEKIEAKAQTDLDAALFVIGNIVHQSVPVSKDEANNAIVKKWGEYKKIENARHHHELLTMIGGYEPERGQKVAGHRGYYLTGMGVALNQALINYGLQFLTSKGYTCVQTPFFMRKDVMGKVAQLSQYDEELYKVVGDEDAYLIATSEQPLAALHIDETIEPKQLPIKYAGISTCFRKEAGAHGKDTWGIFRVHQFEKVEQFVITSPEKSWEMHEEMLKLSEEFYQSLGIPYHVVAIVSGELNNAAAKKYDLEGWFPAFQEFRELVSCSNCTDYQARRMETRYGHKGTDGQKKYVHMLNSTLCATGRAICAILENHQTDKGIKIPSPLLPFMLPYLPKDKDGKQEPIIPFIKDPPKKKAALKKAEEKQQQQQQNK